MLTGVGDAENLAWKLALVVRGRAGERLLETYQAERRPLAAEVLRGTTAVTRLDIARNPIGRFLRDRVLIRLFNFTWIQRWTTYTTSQLWVSYRRGPLGGGSRLARRPRPGDRVPDLECVRPDGTGTRLHGELGGRWALVVPPGGAPACGEAGRKRLGDGVATLTSTDRSAPEEVSLIRPDGHLAWRGRPDPARLGRWLDDALQHGQARG